MNLLVTEPLLNPAPLVRQKVCMSNESGTFPWFGYFILHSSRRLVGLIGASQAATWPVTDRYHNDLAGESRFQQVVICSAAKPLSTVSPRNRKRRRSLIDLEDRRRAAYLVR